MTWNAIAGTLVYWANEQLRDEGRRVFKEAKYGFAATPEGSGLLPAVHQSFGFVAHRRPWRAGMIVLGEGEEEDTAKAVAWADEAVGALRGNPAQLMQCEGSWGDSGLFRMLVPFWINDFVLEKGHEPLLLVDGAMHEQLMGVVPEMLSLSADRYEATYNADLDLLTEWRAVIDGNIAQRTSLLNLCTL